MNTQTFNTKEEFFLDMLEFYTQDTDRRCVDENGHCFYYVKGKKGCAIGRFLNSKIAQGFDKEELHIRYIINHTLAGIPAWMFNFGANFLRQIQILHDENMYWDLKNKTLSDDGKRKVKDILKEYDISEEKFKKYIE